MKHLRLEDLLGPVSMGFNLQGRLRRYGAPKHCGEGPDESPWSPHAATRPWKSMEGHWCNDCCGGSSSCVHCNFLGTDPRGGSECQDQETMVSCLIVCSMSHFDDFYVLQNRPSRQRFRIVAHSRSFTLACVPLISNSPGFPSEIHHSQRAMLMTGSWNEVSLNFKQTFLEARCALHTRTYWRTGCCSYLRVVSMQCTGHPHEFPRGDISELQGFKRQ